MAVARQHQTTVSTSAVALAGTQYSGFILKNTHASEALYIGDSAVTTANGFPVAAGATFSPTDLFHRSFQGKSGERLYGIAATGPIDVRVLIQGRINV